jgi:hypothetical protein
MLRAENPVLLHWFSEVLHMTTLLAQLKAGSRILLYLVVAFLVIQLWQDPTGSADAVVDFLGAVGSFCSTVVEKLSDFFSGLTD